MKKVLAFLLAAAVCASLVLCGCEKSDEPSPGSETIVGGWTAPDSPVVSDDVKGLLEKATETLAGASYKPVAYLGSQVVAGTNHRLLCECTPTVPDAEATYAVVTLYEDLEGNVSISGILSSEAQVNVTDEALDGGWSAPATPELTTEAVNALQKAAAHVTGASYSPVVLLGTQVVAGTNYSLLCEITPVTENAESHYAVVTVYEGADGNTSVLETIDFTADTAE